MTYNGANMELQKRGRKKTLSEWDHFFWLRPFPPVSRLVTFSSTHSTFTKSRTFWMALNVDLFIQMLIDSERNII